MDITNTPLPYVRISSSLYRVVLQDMTKAQRGLLLSLICFCAMCRNGGRIKGCRNWPRSKWTKTMQMFCNISEEVQKLCNILAWDGDDLLVLVYPAEDERKANAQAALRSSAPSFARVSAYAQEENRREKEKNKLKKQYIPMF